MIQLRLVVLVVLFSTPLLGQIEIDWTEVPQDIGIEFTHNGAESVTVNLGQSGGPQTWNFSAQPMGAQYTDALIVPRVSTPFGDSFPNSNLVLEITEGSDVGYAYGEIAPTFGANLGFGSVSPLTVFFRFEPTDSYPMPMVYGNSRVYHYGYSIYPVPLTTIRAPQHEIGKKAAEILIRNIESSKLLPPEQIFFETEFIIRASTRVLNHG